MFSCEEEFVCTSEISCITLGTNPAFSPKGVQNSLYLVAF